MADQYLVTKDKVWHPAAGVVFTAAECPYDFLTSTGACVTTANNETEALSKCNNMPACGRVVYAPGKTPVVLLKAGAGTLTDWPGANTYERKNFLPYYIAGGIAALGLIVLLGFVVRRRRNRR